MSILSALATDDSINTEKDSVGSSFGPIDSGLYNMTVSLAYLKTANSGALALSLELKSDAGQIVRQDLWMTSGTAKGGKNYYEKDGEKFYLPGFITANSLALLTLGKEIGQLETETKVINLYSSEAKAEVPTKVDMFTDLLGMDIIAGIIRQTVDKNVKDGAGNYVPSGETRDENEIDKFFRTRDRKTTAEVRAQAESAVFIDTWNEKWAGKVRNKAKGASGTSGAPKPGTGMSSAGNNTATKKPATSLFG